MKQGFDLKIPSQGHARALSYYPEVTLSVSFPSLGGSLPFFQRYLTQTTSQQAAEKFYSQSFSIPVTVPSALSLGVALLQQELMTQALGLCI